MAKKRLSPGITDLGGGRYRIRVSGGYNPVTGDRVMFDKTIRDSTSADAENVRAGFLLRIGETPDAKDLTVSAYFDGWLFPFLERQKAAGKIRRTTMSGYRSRYKCHIKEQLGAVKLAKLSRFILTSWLTDLALLPRFGQQSQQHCFVLMHMALVRAVEWEILTKNPLRWKDDAPGVPTVKHDVYSASDANKLLDSVVGSPIEAAVVTGMAAWLRRCELAALTWNDYRFWTDTIVVDGRPVKVDRAEVNIWRGFHQLKQEVWFEDCKTEDSAQVMPLPSWAATRLKQIRGFGPISTEDGEQMKPDRLAYHFRNHLKAHGLPHIPIMYIRHTGASLGVEDGLSLTEAMLRLRHREIATTRRYLNLSDGFAAGIAEAGSKWRSTQADTKGTSTQLVTQEQR